MAASFHLSVCRYRGQKTRYARSILDIIRINPSDSFWDICCGSGAISIAAIESRAVRPEQITMVESGPWGHFWNRIAIGDFDIQRFEQVIADVPDDQRQIPSYMNALFDKPCPDQDSAIIWRHRYHSPHAAGNSSSPPSSTVATAAGSSHMVLVGRDVRCM